LKFLTGVNNRNHKKSTAIGRKIELSQKFNTKSGMSDNLSRPFHIHFFNSCQEININPFRSSVS
jgi:hypothetical protein